MASRVHPGRPRLDGVFELVADKVEVQSFVDGLVPVSDTSEKLTKSSIRICQILINHIREKGGVSDFNYV